MKNLNLIYFLLVFAFGCSSDESRDDQSLIIGRWHDIHTYPSTVIDSSGNETIVDYPNIEFEFKEDNSFQLNDEVVTGVHGNGKWRMDDENRLVEFFDIDTELNDTLSFDYERSHAWEVVELTDDSLKVWHNYIGEPIFGSNDTIKYSFYRRFARLK